MLYKHKHTSSTTRTVPFIDTLIQGYFRVQKRKINVSSFSENYKAL